MGVLTMAGLRGGSVEVPTESVSDFASTLRGGLLLAGDPGYDQARMVWNGMVDRSPAAVARCAGASDVVAAVRWARRHDLLVSVRGGGHNVAGNAVCEQGLMIDLSPMRSVRVDPSRRTVRVDPGCTWAEVDAETQAFGLATTGGTVSTTGVAGLTLGGGGIGHLTGLHGSTCDNLRSVDVVTATGEYLSASADENAELFWAMRGAGANFGIVTSFELEVHPLGPMVFGGMSVFPGDRFAEVLRLYADLCADAPDELALVAGLVSDPEGAPLAALMLGWFGPEGGADAQAERIRALSPMMSELGPVPYRSLQSLLDAGVPAGLPRYWKSGVLTRLDDSVRAAIVRHSLARPTPLCAVLLLPIHGAISRHPTDETAFAARLEGSDIEIVAQWDDPAMESESIAWARSFFETVQPAMGGVYLNHLGSDDGLARVRAAYGDNWDRLVELKSKYDPDNFFRLNNNIPLP